MATKRPSECMQDIISSKMLKQVQDNDGDVQLDTSNLSSDIRCSLSFDSVLKTFSVTLEKERKEGDRFICLGEEEIRNVIKFLPVIEHLVVRYSSRKSPIIIDIPFEASSGHVGDLITVLSLKENTYKRGCFDVDIRKCVKKEDGSYQYTSEGVRFSQSFIGVLREKLSEYQSLVSLARYKTNQMITMSMATAITREIRELAQPRKNCYGCQIDHPSQDQHTGVEGCLSSDQLTWGEICYQYWHAGKNLITNDEVQDIAKRAVSRIPELEKTFMHGLISMEQIPDHEVKEYVLTIEELAEDEPVLKILADILPNVLYH